MRKVVTIFSLVVVLICGVAFNAEAIPISGAVSFSGTSSFDNNDLTLATKFTSFGVATVSSTGGSGDYSGLIGGTPVTFTPFTFRPALSPSPLVPLWTATVGGTTYSFDAPNLTINFSSKNDIVMGGTGWAHMTGKDDTVGLWTISANSAGATASFSSSAIVPEPSTLLLMGSGLLSLFGLLALRKKLTG